MRTEYSVPPCDVQKRKGSQAAIPQRSHHSGFALHLDFACKSVTASTGHDSREDCMPIRLCLTFFQFKDYTGTSVRDIL